MWLQCILAAYFDETLRWEVINDKNKVIIQAFIRKGHSTDKNGTEILRPLLFLSKYLYFWEILIFLR